MNNQALIRAGSNNILTRCAPKFIPFIPNIFWIISTEKFCPYPDKYLGPAGSVRVKSRLFPSSGKKKGTCTILLVKQSCTLLVECSWRALGSKYPRNIIERQGHSQTHDLWTANTTDTPCWRILRYTAFYFLLRAVGLKNAVICTSSIPWKSYFLVIPVGFS